MATTEGDVMTDNQWFGVLRLVAKVLRRCKTVEEALEEIEDLLRSDKSYEEKKQISKN